MRQERRPLSILYVAYPLLTVSEESAGGAEQTATVAELSTTVPCPGWDWPRPAR